MQKGALAMEAVLGTVIGCIIIAGTLFYVADCFMEQYCDPALDALERIANTIAGEDKDKNTEGEESE